MAHIPHTLNENIKQLYYVMHMVVGQEKPSFVSWALEHVSHELHNKRFSFTHIQGPNMIHEVFHAQWWHHVPGFNPIWYNEHNYSSNKLCFVLFLINVLLFHSIRPHGKVVYTNYGWYSKMITPQRRLNVSRWRPHRMRSVYKHFAIVISYCPYWSIWKPSWYVNVMSVVYLFLVLSEDKTVMKGVYCRECCQLITCMEWIESEFNLWMVR